MSQTSVIDAPSIADSLSTDQNSVCTTVRLCPYCQAALLSDGRCSAACFPHPGHVVGLPKHPCPRCGQMMALTIAKDNRKLLLNPRSGNKHVCSLGARQGRSSDL